MLLSMTGYGRATRRSGDKTFTVELRALNSKQSDLRLRSSRPLHQYELPLRKLVLGETKRGKVEVSVDLSDESGEGTASLNLPLLASLYRKAVYGLTAYTDTPPSEGHMHGLLPHLIRVPGVVDTGSADLPEEDWELLQATTKEALGNLYDYRKQEGEALESDFKASVHAIQELLERVPSYEEERIGTVRERMERHLEEFSNRGKVDQNRYEQEVIFYLEKMDINEEKVRLAQNCEYFLEILGNKDEVKGRKLTFIGQEIGREINTLGAKAHHAELQKLVVNMKEQLEMIKEQLANVA